MIQQIIKWEFINDRDVLLFANESRDPSHGDAMWFHSGAVSSGRQVTFIK